MIDTSLRHESGIFTSVSWQESESFVQNLNNLVELSTALK